MEQQQKQNSEEDNEILAIISGKRGQTRGENLPWYINPKKVHY